MILQICLQTAHDKDTLEAEKKIKSIIGETKIILGSSH